MAKTYEKALELFKEMDLGEQIVYFYELRTILEKGIEEKKAQLAEQLNSFQEIQGQIKKQ